MIRRSIWLLAVTVVMLPACLEAQDPEHDAQRLIAQSRFSEARAIYQQLSADNRDNIEYRVWIARLSAWLEEYAAALAGYDDVLASEPGNTEAMVGKAYVFIWQRRYSEAESILAAARQTGTQNSEIEVALARLHHYQGHHRAARTHVDAALRMDPQNQEARDLRAEINVPLSVELRIGYGQDRFSFADTGHMGYLNAAYMGETSRFGLQYEEWSRFGDRTRRAGFNVAHNWNGWWLRGGGMWGPGAVVVPRREYTAGFGRALKRPWVLDGDYRYLRFRDAEVHLAAPAISYYFAKPSWAQVTLFTSWTRETNKQDSDAHQSWMAQYFHQIAKPIVLHAGYARGTESFDALSIDRLGAFKANTYFGGAEIRIPPGYPTKWFCAYQVRSNNSRQASLGVNLTLRK